MAQSDVERRRFLQICAAGGITGFLLLMDKIIGGSVTDWRIKTHQGRIEATAVAYRGEIDTNELLESIRTAMAMVGIYYEDPFGEAHQRLGTGVFIYNDRGMGVLLTNDHVVSDGIPEGSKLTSLGMGEAESIYSGNFDFTVDGNSVFIARSKVGDVALVGFRYLGPELVKWKPIGVDWQAKPESVGKMAAVFYQGEFDSAGAKRGIPVPSFGLLRDENGNIMIGKDDGYESGVVLVEFTADFGSSGTPAVSLDSGKVVGLFGGFMSYPESENAYIQFLGDVADMKELMFEVLGGLSKLTGP